VVNVVGAEAIIQGASILLGGGLFGILLRYRPEKANLLAEANEKTVRLLISTMDELEDRLSEAQKREAQLLKEMSDLRQEMSELRQKLHEHKNTLVRLSVERDAWKQRAIDSGWKDK